jgi:hypothetical protein
MKPRLQENTDPHAEDLERVAGATNTNTNTTNTTA